MNEHPENILSSSYGKLMVICCGVAFGCYFASYMRLPVVPLYARSIGINMAQIGFINAAFFLLAGLFSLPLGIVSDRIGRKKMASIGLLLLSGTSFLLCLSETFIQLVGIYIFFGIAMAAVGPTMMSFVADVSPHTHLGRSYGWYTLAIFGGMSIGPVVGGMITQFFGFISVFLTSGILLFLNLGLLIRFFPATEKTPASTPEREKASAVFKNLFYNRPLLICWLTALGGCFGTGMFITYIPLHAQNQDINAAKIGMIFFAQALSNALSRIPFGRLSDRVAGRGNLVIAGLFGFAVAMIGFGISETMTQFILFATIQGVSTGLAFTSLVAFVVEVVPSNVRGIAMGGYNACLYLGMMLSSAVMGPVIQGVGFRIGFYITAGCNFVLIAIFYFMMKRFSGVRL